MAQSDIDAVGQETLERGLATREETSGHNVLGELGRWSSLVIRSPIAQAVVLAILAWPFSATTLEPCAGLDCSWQGTLDRAAVLRLPYGTHILFTYGPLGFLVVPRLYEVPTAIASFVFVFGVIVAVFCVILLSLRSAVPLWLALPIAYVVGSTVVFGGAVLVTNGSIPLHPQLLLVFVLGIGIAILRSAGLVPRFWWFGLGAVSGLSFLIQPSMVIGLAVISALAVLCIDSYRRIAAGYVLLGAVCSSGVAWFATGNGFTNLLPFVTRSLTVASGYSAGMGLGISPSSDVIALTVLDIVLIGGVAIASCWRLSNLKQLAIAAMTTLVLWRLFRFQWGRVEESRGGRMGRGQVTPPAWSSTRSL